jgi:O-antigen ligase
MRSLPKHTIGFLLAASVLAPAIVASIYFDQWWISLAAVLLSVGIFAWDHPRILLTWLWISLPLSMEFSFSDRLGTDLPDEPLMIGVSLLTFFYVIYHRKKISQNLLLHPLMFLFLLWISWMGIAALVSTTPWLSLKFMLAKGWYTGAFLVAPLLWLRTRTDIQQMIRYLFIPLLSIAVLTLIRHAFSGFSFMSASEVVQPFFRNHVVYSAMLVTAVPVLYFYRKHSLVKWRGNLLLGIVLAALFFSYARGAWLALLVGVIAYLLLRQRLLLYGYVMAVLLLIAGFVWLKYDDRYLDYAPDYRTTIFHPEFSDHWEATYQGKDVSTVERFYRWIAGVRMVAARPLTGFGPATFYTSYRSYTIPAYKTWVSDNSDRSTVHNYFLLTAIEQGVPGLILFLLLLGAILYYAERLYHQQKENWLRSVAAGIGIVVVMLGVVNFWSDLIETDKIGSLFFLSIALLLILDRRDLRLTTADV